MLTIVVVSDATGEMAERMVRSALVQFRDAETTLVRRGQVHTLEQVQAVVHEAAGQNTFIVHTLVSTDLRRTMLEACRLHGLDAMDLMGPMLDRLSTRLHLPPLEQPGLFKQLAEARTREIEAVEFVLAHDDGQRPEELSLAEIVVVGVSRTMKTPTTLYLAYRGWFVANIPLVVEVPPPEELLALPAERVFYLDISAERLQELRRVRAEAFNIPKEPYITLTQIEKELRYARQLSRRYGWRSIDVSGKSVEEVCHEIITLRGQSTPSE